MTPGSLITQFRRARRQQDWTSQVSLLKAVISHGPDAVARLRDAVEFSASEFSTLAAVAAEPSYLLWDYRLTLRHYRVALAARRLFPDDAKRGEPAWWIHQARTLGWNARELAWALRHPETPEEQRQAAHDAWRLLENQVRHFNQRYGRVAGCCQLVPACMAEQGAS